MIGHQIYKLTPSSTGIEIKKIGEEIEGTKCSGTAAWHQEMYPTDIGLVFFKVRGENKNEDG